MYKRFKVTPSSLNDDSRVSTSVLLVCLHLVFAPSANIRCKHHENGRDLPRYVAGNLQLQKLQILCLGFRFVQFATSRLVVRCQDLASSWIWNCVIFWTGSKVRWIRLSLSSRSVGAHPWSWKICFLHGKSWLGALAKLRK